MTSEKMLIGQKQRIDMQRSFSKQIYRESGRVYLHQYLDVVDTENNKFLGYLSDFSTDGLMFISQQLIALHLLKTIDIQNHFGDNQFTIQARIETLWIKPNINPVLYCIGCRFFSIDTYNRKLLRQAGLAFGFAKNIEIRRESH